MGAHRATSDLYGLVGTVVDGRYRIDGVAGAGGYGVVYRGYHIRFDAPVAVKVLKLSTPHTPTEREGFLASFQAEGKLLFRLSSLHPAIVRAIESGVILLKDGGSVPYLALEWLEGCSLAQDLKRRKRVGCLPYSLSEALALLGPVAEALASAHAQGVFHRDIKPGNIFLVRAGAATQTKLLDFGLAKVVASVTDTSEMLAATAGAPCHFTLPYGAPEQFSRDLGATGPWTDVFGLALVLVEMITGRPALDGQSASEFLGSSCNQNQRPTPRMRGASVSDEVEAVFARALAVDPASRYLHARGFWEALCAAAGAPCPAMEQAQPVSPGDLPQLLGAASRDPSGRSASIDPPHADPDDSTATTALSGFAPRKPSPSTPYDSSPLSSPAIHPGVDGSLSTASKTLAYTNAPTSRRAVRLVAAASVVGVMAAAGLSLTTWRGSKTPNEQEPQLGGDLRPESATVAARLVLSNHAPSPPATVTPLAAASQSEQHAPSPSTQRSTGRAKAPPLPRPPPTRGGPTATTSSVPVATAAPLPAQPLPSPPSDLDPDAILDKRE